MMANVRCAQLIFGYSNRLFKLNILPTHAQQWSRCLATRGAAVQSKLNVNDKSSTGNAGDRKAQKISNAMKAYLERAKAHDEFMQHELAEYEIGKRHLANIMGEDPDTFNQEDIDKAISYLLPSGLFNINARPQMKHPDVFIPARKAAQFDMNGRPFHFLYFTRSPNMYTIMHDAVSKLEQVKLLEDKRLRQGQQPNPDKQLILASSAWVGKEAMEKITTEKINDDTYAKFVKLMERLALHPYSYEEKDFIMKFREAFHHQDVLVNIPELLTSDSGRPYIEAEGYRKTAVAKVMVIGEGTGQFKVNGRPMGEHFPFVIDREQLMFPLQFTNLLGGVDIEADVQLGGRSSQAGAIRLAIATALQSFVNKDMLDKMRLAGLLTLDPRVRERKKPGQRGARAKFTWKKR